MTDRALSIRNATIEDIDQLYKWDEKPHVQASISTSGTQSFDVDWKDELSPRTDGTELFIAEAGGVAIGAMQIIDPAKERTHYWGLLLSTCAQSIYGLVKRLIWGRVMVPA